MNDSQKVYRLIIKCKNESINVFNFRPPHILIAMQFLDINGRMKNVFGKEHSDFSTSLFDIIWQFLQILSKNRGSMNIPLIR